MSKTSLTLEEQLAVKDRILADEDKRDSTLVEIKQIIPADGWYAKFGPVPGYTSEPELQPLACWALCQMLNGTRRILGMVAHEESMSLEPACFAKNFLSYTDKP